MEVLVLVLVLQRGLWGGGKALCVAMEAKRHSYLELGELAWIRH